MQEILRDFGSILTERVKWMDGQPKGSWSITGFKLVQEKHASFPNKKTFIVLFVLRIQMNEYRRMYTQIYGTPFTVSLKWCLSQMFSDIASICWCLTSHWPNGILNTVVQTRELIISLENRRMLFGIWVWTEAHDDIRGDMWALECSPSVVNACQTTTCVIISAEFSVRITGFCVGACN